MLLTEYQSLSPFHFDSDHIRYLRIVNPIQRRCIMTELRNKMIKSMQLRNLSPKTQRSYLDAVSGLARHYMKSPDQISKDMVEDYLLYLRNDKGRAPNTIGTKVSGLKFLYRHVLHNEENAPDYAQRRTRKLPVVLTQEEIWKIIDAPDNLKHRLMLMTIYSAGLRASEVIALKPEHIDSKRMLIKVENGTMDKTLIRCQDMSNC